MKATKVKRAGSKSKTPVRILASTIAIVLATSGLGWGVALAQASGGVDRVSDDIRPDGLKRRGDGSIDDDQPGRNAEHQDRGQREDRIKIEDSDVRTRADDGTRSRERTRVTVNPVTGERRERTRIEVVNPDGSRSEIRSEKRIAADGTVLRERTRTRERAARGERAERGERAARGERAERPERADRSERGERSERSERSDRNS